MAARSTGAASGKRPTGPLVRNAPITASPEAIPHPTAAAVLVDNAAKTTQATARIVKTETVTSRRLPTTAHETIGTAIHRRTGSQP